MVSLQTGLTVAFDKHTTYKYTLIEATYKTTAKMYAKILRIEVDFPPIYYLKWL